MELIKKIKSASDNVEKFIFKSNDGFVVEMSYIDNGTDKDIICVPTHTMCNIGCKFCHTTDYIGKIKCKQLTHHEICDGVDIIVSHTNISKNKRTLLISYMGCGEPMENVGNVVDSMILIKSDYTDRYVRFAVATCLPKNKWFDFFEFTKWIKASNLDVKIHFSLHYTHDEIRKQWMPNSLEIKPSLDAMSFYKEITGNKVEIHYALIEGVNDEVENRIWLETLLRNRDFNVKFLFYNEKPTIEEKASSVDKYNKFSLALTIQGIKSEYYTPPGLDIGASCGQFLMDFYEEMAMQK